MGQDGPRSFRHSGGSAVDAHPGEDVLEAEAAGRSRTASARSGRGGLLTEEDAEEVGELAGIAAGPELVADVAARARATEPAAVGTERTARAATGRLWPG